MNRRVTDLIPTPVRRSLRNLYYLSVDTIDLIVGRRGKMVPPKRIRPDYVISSGFIKHGDDFVENVTELGQLKPNGRVLDIGCGIGRIAVPLTRYLTDEGSYEGLDIVPDSIAWCQKEIASRFSNFQFQLADVYNSRYNPAGTQHACEYTFPYEDDSFDLVLLKSVFTHMLPDDINNYLGEIARTLRKEGRVLITFFLLNKASLLAMEEGSARRKFDYSYGFYRAESDQILESAIAYDEEYIKQQITHAGLEIEEPIHFGTWSGRREGRFAQDIVVSLKLTGESTDREY